MAAHALPTKLLYRWFTSFLWGTLGRDHLGQTERVQHFGCLMKVCKCIVILWRWLIFTIRTIYHFLRWRWRRGRKKSKTGTSPKCTCWCTASTISRRKGPREITTQSRTRSSMARSRSPLRRKPTSRMLHLRFVAIIYFIMLYYYTG